MSGVVVFLAPLDAGTCIAFYFFLRGNNITIKKICIFVVFQGSADVVYVDMKWYGNDLSVVLFANNAGGLPLNTPGFYPFTGEWSYT